MAIPFHFPFLSSSGRLQNFCVFLVLARCCCFIKSHSYFFGFPPLALWRMHSIRIFIPRLYLFLYLFFLLLGCGSSTTSNPTLDRNSKLTRSKCCLNPTFDTPHFRTDNKNEGKQACADSHYLWYKRLFLKSLKICFFKKRALNFMRPPGVRAQKKQIAAQRHETRTNDVGRAPSRNSNNAHLWRGTPPEAFPRDRTICVCRPWRRTSPEATCHGFPRISECHMEPTYLGSQGGLQRESRA